MSLDWSRINKALCEHWRIVTAPMLDNRHFYGYNPKRLNYADFLKTEEGRQEMTAYGDYEFSHRGTETGRITEAEYERRQAMNGDLFTKNETDIALLRRCIEEKWIPIYEGRKTDEGNKNCVLCKRYAGCEKCPIREASGCIQCGSTPYVTQWKRVANFYETADTPEKKLAALQEILYLEGLIAKLTKVEEEEKKKQSVLVADMKAAAAIQARIEKEKKVYFPYVFYITLEESTKDFNFRLDLRDEVEKFLKEQGMKVKDVRYGYGTTNHLIFSQKTGCWRVGDATVTDK